MIVQIRPADFPTWLDTVKSTRPPILLDVREDWEVEAAHITPDGYELVTIPMGDVPSRAGELDISRPVACLCHHGGRSQRVAALLVQRGFRQVANIAGGIDAWSLECDASIPRY